MTPAAAKKKWDALHAAYAKARAAADEYERELRARYFWPSNERQWRTWLKKTERDKIERLQERAMAVGHKLVDLIVEISPRGEAWLHGVPAAWLRDELTWEDAMRPANEPLSVVVPGAYGYPDGYMKEARRPGRANPRNRRTGRYSFGGDMDKLCVCGHRLGVHGAEPPHPCFNGDPGVPGATGQPCPCARFRPAAVKESAKFGRGAAPTSEYAWWKAAERKCFRESHALTQALMSGNQDEIQRANEAIRECMAKKGMPFTFKEASRAGEARRERQHAGPTSLRIDDELSARLIGTGTSKTLGNKPTETWVVEPHDEPGAAVLQVTLFRSGAAWSAWTGNYTRSRDRELAEQVAAARNAAHGSVSEARENYVADFNTVDDLLEHAAREFGATHVLFVDDEIHVYFPRRDGTYEKAEVWQKDGYWHAQGPGARTIVQRPPSNAQPIDEHETPGRELERHSWKPGMDEARRSNKPQRASYDIATMEGGRETVTGYVLGDWGMRKGQYFWDYTHLPTGALINVYPPHDNLKSALAHLEHLNTYGPPEHQKEILARGGWGLQNAATLRKILSTRY